MCMNETTEVTGLDAASALLIDNTITQIHEMICDAQLQEYQVELRQHMSRLLTLQLCHLRTAVSPVVSLNIEDANKHLVNSKIVHRAPITSGPGANPHG
jgi:hypothetical protein